MRRLRILLADDHPEMLDRVKRILEPDYDIVATIPDPMAVVDAVRRLRPDVVVMDIAMPIVTGLEVARRFKGPQFALQIIFVTVHEDPDFLEEAREVGAGGYVLKHRLATDLLPAVKEVVSGGTFYPSLSNP